MVNAGKVNRGILLDFFLVLYSTLVHLPPPSDSTVSEDAGIEPRSQIHEHTVLLKFLGLILRVLRLKVSVYNVYITNQFHTTSAWGGGGG